MRELLPPLQAALRDRRPFIWCRLVETRGSTPQKAGATMLVFADGSQAGTLGGGCVEAEVKRRALGLLAEGRAEVCKFQLDSDYGWDDGLICGGRMQVLVEPATSPAAIEYYQRLAAEVAKGKGITEAIVFDSEASGLAAPASYLFDHEGRLYKADACPPMIREHLRPIASRPRPYVLKGVAYLPVLPRCRLVIVGGGHVGKAVADLATDLEFDVWIVDDRAEFASPERFPRAERRMSGPIDRILPDLEITADTYCLIVTRGHNHDQEALFHLANRGARYVGLIGSRRKIKLIFDNLVAAGISREALAAVHAPLGIDIGSQTVPEIAVSICAELVAHRNLGSVPGRARSVEV
ncbi:MAG TPA: XdhC family protein [Pirellulales bacterium]|nr:XdhC family protein [Pirellulales bacterium]